MLQMDQYMATSTLYLHRDFGLTVHHGNFILTGGAAAPPDPPHLTGGAAAPPDPPAFPGGEGCRPPPRPPHLLVLRGSATQTPLHKQNFPWWIGDAGLLKETK